MAVLWCGINLKRSVLGFVNSRMRQVQRVGDPNDGGGIIQTTPQSSVVGGGKAIAVTGSRGTNHGSRQHGQNQWTVQANTPTISLGGLSISLSGDLDSCGHRRAGSSNIFIGEGGNPPMACEESSIPYVTPEGKTTIYTPAAQQQMGSEAPGQTGGTGSGTIDPNPPKDAIMKDTSTPPPVPPGPPADCSSFTESTDDNVRLSPNFTLAQVTYLAPGNSAPYRVIPQFGLTKAQIMCNLKQMCEKVAEPALAYVKAQGFARLTISSGFRVPGGSSGTGSSHYRGAALDMQVLDMSPQQFFKFAQWASANLPCDQIILEGVGASHHWLHGSMALQGCNTVASSARLLTQTASQSYAPGLFLLNYNGRS